MSSSSSGNARAFRSSRTIATCGLGFARCLPRSASLRYDALWERAGTPRPAASLVSTGHDIRSLEQTGLIEVGAHTASHAVLPDLSPDEQLEEVRSGKAALDRLLGRPTESFSYPHAQFDTTTVDLVRQAGFRRACAGNIGAVRASAPLHALPRVHVEDMPGDAFGRLLDRWLVT